MKLCRGCNRELPEPAFTKNRRSPDGLDWRCRECKKGQVKKYIESEKGRATRQAYYEQTRPRWMELKRLRRREYAAKNPEKVRARWLLGNAVRKGYIPKPSDSRSWHNNWEFHHPDHSRPYFGVWVTPPDHRRIDAGETPCPECTDYTETVRKRVLEEWGLS